MQKFIAAIDGLKYSENTAGYAAYLAKKENAYLVGLMLDDISYSSYRIYDLLGRDGINPAQLKKLEAKDAATRKASAAKLETACRKAGLHHSIHHDKNFALKELLHESIYADLVIIDPAETLTHYEEKRPTRFIRHLLTDVQCPVLLAPKGFKPLNRVIFLYDGGPSSVFAIKMFSYLFPSLESLKIEVLTVQTGNEALEVPDQGLLKEFMKRHFPKDYYTVVSGIPEREILQHLKKIKSNALVVAGSYQRGTVSRWFKASLADVLMEQVNLPLFIAHYK